MAFEGNTNEELAGKAPLRAANLEKLEALADVFELLSIAFSYPTPELTEALVSDNFQADLAACLEELGLLQKETLKLDPDETPESLLASMKREYSRLFLSPGKLAIIYPYESAFLFVMRGGKGMPTLMCNPLTANVEQFMVAAQALPKTYRTEPVDSVYAELDFLRHLYTTALATERSGAEESSVASAQWIDKANEFRQAHVHTWMPEFMKKTHALSRIQIYRQLAEIGLLVLAT